MTKEEKQLKQKLLNDIPEAPQSSTWFVRKVMNRLPDADERAIKRLETAIYFVVIAAVLTALTWQTTMVLSDMMLTLNAVCVYAASLMLSLLLLFNAFWGRRLAL